MDTRTYYPITVSQLTEGLLNHWHEIAMEGTKLAERVGGVGTQGVTDRNTIGVCAEFHVINDMLLSGSKLEDIRLTRPIRQRTGQFMPYCDNCRVMFSEIIESS